jgi:hypothetical protein
MRVQVAAILVAVVVALCSAGVVHADGKGGQGSTSSGTGGSGTSSGSGSSGGGTGTAPTNGPFAPMSVQGWDGGAYRNSSGEAYCELYDDYGSKTSLLVGWDKYGFYLLITDPNTLKLEEYADLEVLVSIDKLYKGKVTAFSYETDVLELDFGDDRKAINALRKGEKLVLEEWDHFYTLYGTGAAIAAVEDCFNRYR